MKVFRERFLPPGKMGRQGDDSRQVSDNDEVIDKFKCRHE